MNRSLKSHKGGSLVLVVMIMAVLMILGISLITISLAETNISVHQLNRSQAYFSARSGAEIALERIKTALASGNYQDVNTLFNDVKTPINGSVDSGEDTFIVNFIDGGLVAQDRIKIFSEGMSHNVPNTTALTIHFTTPSQIPLEWLNPGQIIRSGFWERTTDPVIVNTAKLLGHSPKKSSNSLTTWKAPSIHFIDDDEGFSLEVSHKQLVLQTNLLSFKKKILTKDDNECLKIETFNTQGFLHDNGTRLKYNNNIGTDPNDLIPEGWGVVVVKEGLVRGNKNSYSTIWAAGYYAFAPGTEISKEAHRIDSNKVKLIINPSTIAFIEEVIIRETMLGFNPKHMSWSKD